jgi:tetratricopeptide (TPR) repeat protein
VGSADAQNRLHIYEQALLVVREFPYTGSGLGTFPLLHSTYALLIHVPILPHAHGLLVDVALEQGVFGLLGALLAWGAAAVVGVRALAGREEVLDRPILAAGLLSLAVLVLHGLVDDALYGSRGLLLLWAPAGVVVAAAGRRARMPLGRVGWWLLPGLALAAVLGVLLYGPSLVAAGYANLGAVRQARAELARYDYRHFDQPTLDELRAGLDLSQAVAAYEQALAWEYGQPVARTRLAQLALARGRYAEALTHAEAAWEAGHRDRVVRLIYGDALVANGHVEQGAAVVEGLVWASSRLQGQAFYRYWRGQDWQRAAYAWQAALILEPENEHVRSQAEAAAERAAQE